MWTTTFKHVEGVVEEITHEFDNDVRIVANLKDQRIERYHGKVCVADYTLDPQVMYYYRFLENVAEELKMPVGNDETRLM